MGIFDKLFGKKETSSETKKDCCSQKNSEKIKQDNSNMESIHKYQNIKDTIDINELNLSEDLSEIKKLDPENDNIELYFCGINEYKSSFFQCKKSEQNTSNKIISEWDEYIESEIDDWGGYDLDEIKEKFDNTNELHQDWYDQITLAKTTSKSFIKKFIDNLNEWSKKDITTIYDVMKEIGYEPLGNDGYDQIEEFYNSLGGDTELEWIFDEVDIDKKGNLIDWNSYLYLSSGYLEIGYRKV